MHCRRAAVVVVFVCASVGTPLPAAEPAATAGPPQERPAVAASERHPDLVRLSPREEVWIDPQRKEVVVGGKIALDSGAIEVFACPAGTKEHEAIIATASSARMVHAALLAIGLDPGRPAGFQPVYRPAEGRAVAIRLRWRDEEGNDRECRAQEWVRNSRTGEQLDVDWVFAGSTFWRDPADGREYYQADGGDLICVSNFPTAMIDVPIESAQANDGLLFEAFEGRVPPRGTSVEMVLTAKR